MFYVTMLLILWTCVYFFIIIIIPVILMEGSTGLYVFVKFKLFLLNSFKEYLFD